MQAQAFSLSLSSALHVHQKLPGHVMCKQISVTAYSAIMAMTQLVKRHVFLVAAAAVHSEMLLKAPATFQKSVDAKITTVTGPVYSCQEVKCRIPFHMRSNGVNCSDCTHVPVDSSSSSSFQG